MTAPTKKPAKKPTKKPTKKPAKRKPTRAAREPFRVFHADACVKPLDDGHLDRGELCPTEAEADPKVLEVDPDRAEAAAEVLQAVFLHEKNFDLESEIVQKDGRPVVDQNAEGHIWVTVRLHVPMLDVDTWLDGTHLDHPDNQSIEDEDEDDA